MFVTIQQAHRHGAGCSPAAAATVVLGTVAVVERRPTLDTVAQACGVSRMTVSNVFNRPDQVAAETRERVLRTAQALGYIGPNPTGRSLRHGRTQTIGVLLTERLPYAFTDPGLLQFLQGVATELATCGHALLLLPTQEGPEAGSVAGTALVDGFLIVLAGASDPAVTQVLRRGLPAVSWGQPRLPGVPRIGIDNTRAAAEVARHLHDLGHRRVGVISFGAGRQLRAVHQTMRQRVTGFSAVFAADPQAVVQVVHATANTRSAGSEAARDLLAAEPRPTAIFAVTDVLALGALDEAMRQRIAVPAELSVAGFDDIPEAARAVPPLTTFSQALAEQGRAAARMLLDRIAGRAGSVPALETRLVVRGSTAPASVLVEA
ncbi:MAG: LacI family DNA-binding transcriptional regulator [Acidothermus cellulolyticus]|nr:LacI family DNA-binding transcriptional regulator [Acidothermus cellulolyticus]